MSEALDDFAALERRGWQRVAPRYEDTWSSLTRLFVPHLLDVAWIGPGAQLLDVACGPGYVAESARARGARPIGIDFSSEMVRLARLRCPEIEFREGDAQRLDFQPGRFDVVVMNFGLLHLPDPEAALSEARRVLRKGGRFAFTVWAGPELSPGARIVDDAVKAHADAAAEFPRGPDSFGYGDEATCGETLARFGFDPSTFLFQTVTEEWRVPTTSFLYEAERDVGVRTAALLAAQKPEALDAIRRQIEESVSRYAKDDAFALPFAAHVVAATARI